MGGGIWTVRRYTVEKVKERFDRMVTAGANATPDEVLIGAGHRISGQQWAEVWRARELTWLVAKREVRQRYQHSVAGIGWAILQPVITVMVLTTFQVLFGRRTVDRVPYPLYAMMGLVPWTFFGHALNQCSNSILKHTSIVKKVYFPLLVFPVAAVVAAAVDFVVALPLVGGLMLYYGYYPTRLLLMLPLFVLELVLFAAGSGIWIALMNTRYRDTANALPFVMQLWFLMTPIVYSASQVPDRWRILVGLNPMVGLLEGFRWTLCAEAPADLGIWVATSVFWTVLLLGSGLGLWFAQHETLRELN